MILRATLLISVLFMTVSVSAAERFIGKWSEDPKLCETGDFHWTFLGDRFFNEAFTCLNATYKKTGNDTWLAQSKHCQNEENAFSDKERISISGNELIWKGKRFQRCPDGSDAN